MEDVKNLEYDQKSIEKTEIAQHNCTILTESISRWEPLGHSREDNGRFH